MAQLFHGVAFQKGSLDLHRWSSGWLNLESIKKSLHYEQAQLISERNIHTAPARPSDDHGIMSDNRNRLYIGLGVLAGVLLTLGFKDVYPDLERRFRRRSRRYSTAVGSRRRSAFVKQVQMADHTIENSTDDDVPIPEGIEGCIGNTPLFKIRSLSEATGCEILAKAEVDRIRK